MHQMELRSLRSYIRSPWSYTSKVVWALGEQADVWSKHDITKEAFSSASPNERQKFASWIVTASSVSPPNAAPGDEQGENEAETEGTKKNPAFHGGGDHKVNSDASPLAVKKQLHRLFQKLLTMPGSERIEGRDFWDARKLARAKFNPSLFPNSKHARKKELELFFILDDSGSMNEHCQLFLGLLKASAGLVRCFAGQEAHPTDGKNGETYSEHYHARFADDLAIWLKKINPSPGSVLLFWGDTLGMHIRGDEAKVRKMLRPYKAFWLGTMQPGDRHYTHSLCEQHVLPDAGFKVITPVTSAFSLGEAVKRIK